MVPGTIFTTLLLLRNLRNGPISQSVCHQPAIPANSYVTLQLIGLIRKLQRKCSAVNMVPGTVFTTLLLCNSQNGPISQSVCHWHAIPTECYVTLQLIGLICKLQRKCSVVNMVPGTVFTTLLLLRNLRNGPIS